MSTLSDATVVTILTALRVSRDQDLKILRHYDAEGAVFPDFVAMSACFKATKERLEHIAAALRELAAGVAPWIKSYPELKSVFEQA